MKLMCHAKRLSLAIFWISLIALLSSYGTLAQSRKKANTKRPVAKKTESRAKDARKDSRNNKSAAKAKDTRKDSKHDKLTAKNKDRDNARDKKDNKKKDPKLTAKAKREADARRRAEEERRQAIIAEQRRREEAARAARARQLAFERGLHTQTTENIAKDNTDGEDLQIRRAAVNALGSRAGTVVVMEAQTGKVVTIVNQDWAIRNGFKPCSTIKLVTGVAGLSENVIDNDGNINNANVRIKLDDAIAFSNNVYFQRVGSNLGSSKMVSYARMLGLGEPTGINADGETAGRVPNGNNNARIYSHGDDFEVTPLQLAVLVSEISNGGKRVVPQIAKTRYESSNFRSRYRQQINLPQRDLQEMIPGMIGAAEYGTAHRGVDANLGIAGKTGSCIGKGSWVGLFTSVAPIENPKYAVVVITRGPGERGKYAAAVAGKIYEELAPRLNLNPNRAEVLAKFRPKSEVDSRSAAKLSDEEDEDETDDSADSDTKTEARPTWVPPAKRSGDDTVIVSKPLVKRTVDSKPVYSPPKTVETKPAFPAPENRPAANAPGKGKTSFPPVVITYKKDTGDVERPATQRPRIVKNEK